MEGYHSNISDYGEPHHQTTYEPTSGTDWREGNCDKTDSLESLTTFSEDGRCPEASNLHISDSQFFERLKSPVLADMEQKMDEFWLSYDPQPYLSSSNYELRASSSLERQRQEQLQDKPEQSDEQKHIRLVTGPSPQHVHVPEWVYFVRSNEKLFKAVMEFFFRAMHWPDFRELPYWFRRKCSAKKIHPDNFRLTSGFAPVWVFLLKELCDAESVDKEWINRCIDEFFNGGEFPEIDKMPSELEELCQKTKIQPNHFYEVLND